MNYAIIAAHPSGDTVRALLQLECGNRCTVPLVKGAARMGASKVWGWDGAEQQPTVTPSIDCGRCGFHKTLTAGAWR